jgi:hypothetical protein
LSEGCGVQGEVRAVFGGVLGGLGDGGFISQASPNEPSGQDSPMLVLARVCPECGSPGAVRDGMRKIERPTR